ncbi:MAG TPA: ATP-dependent Clp protease proteolytic subunit [Patescibacteria group bacterium]|nr:ATP-dependent Clp protease proteolytic subunit [Patescibacteria group bacterium]
MRQRYDKKPRRRLDRKFVKPTNFTTFIDDNIDIDNRVIHMFDEISPETVNNAIKGIQIMLAKDKTKPIDIYINSEGGCPYSSFGLYDFIKCQQGTLVRTYNCGCAMSGASIIFLAGDERYMYEHSVFMLHSVSSAAEGKVYLNLQAETEECKLIHKDLCQIYADNTKIPYKEWYRWLKFEDKYFRAAKALELGIVHKILKP